MKNIVLLSELSIKVEYLKYFKNKIHQVKKLEEINDRGFKFKDYVTRDETYTAEVSANSNYDYTEKHTKTIPIKSYLKTLNEQSKTKEINLGIKALEEHIAYLEKTVKSVVEDEMYADKFKQEFAEKASKDKRETEMFIETLDGYKNNKDRKSELAKIRKSLRAATLETEEYLVEKWKYNDKYITLTERKLNEKYPELKIEFAQTRHENVATIVDVNGELKIKTVKGRL